MANYKKNQCTAPRGADGERTVDRCQQHPGVVICYHVSISVLRLVHFQVGVFPRELLARVDGLKETNKQTNRELRHESHRKPRQIVVALGEDPGLPGAAGCISR